jgi:hypothetical protein
VGVVAVVFGVLAPHEHTSALLSSLAVCFFLSLPFAYARRDTPIVIPRYLYRAPQQ